MQINHATRLSFYREFYALEVKANGKLDLQVRVLNIFQRIIRYLFGAYSNTVWNQQKSIQIKQQYPREWKKIEDKIVSRVVFKQVFKIDKDQEEIQTYLEKKEFLVEQNESKIIDTLHWVLDNYEECDRELVKLYIRDLVKKSRALSLNYERTYMSWLETLSDEQLAIYIQIAPKKGNDSPLFYHLQQESLASTLTGKSNYDNIGHRMKIAFSNFTAEHAKVVYSNEDFWNLVYKFPAEAAESLKPEALAVLVKNKKKHKLTLSKVIARFPDDDLLQEKLTVMAPYATTDIELVMRSKAERLDKINNKTNDKKDVKRKIGLGVSTPRLDRLKEGDDDENSLENVKSRNSRSFKFQSIPKDIKTTPQPTVVPRKITWSNEQSISFLNEKKYKLKSNPEEEEIVFNWILNHENIIEKNEHLRAESFNFIKYVLTQPLYIENSSDMLNQLKNNQLRFFVKLLGTELIDILWNLEAKFTVSQSSVENKITRLETILDTLSEEQFEASLDCVKFYEILRNYPKELNPLLTVDHWALIAEHSETEDQVLTALSALVSKLDVKEDPEFSEKLVTISCLIKTRTEDENKILRDGLRYHIQSKLKFCTKDAQTRIKANI